jgi:hypothetical protein
MEKIVDLIIIIIIFKFTIFISYNDYILGIIFFLNSIRYILQK